jgi:small subunit ribosomal protein S4
MARHTGPVCRLCRREGMKLYLKGDRCYSEKCAVDKRSYPPGQRARGRRKETEYGLQLREKQRTRRIYGVYERQFRRYFDLAERQQGITGENLLRLLETRLDNVVYRLGFAQSRAEARQLVRHGHFTVNGKRVNIPSYHIRTEDEIAVQEKSRELPRVGRSLSGFPNKNLLLRKSLSSIKPSQYFRKRSPG